MRRDTWATTEELRQPGMRRVLDGIRLISKEMCDFDEDANVAVLPAGTLMRGQPEGGRPAQ